MLSQPVIVYRGKRAERWIERILAGDCMRVDLTITELDVGGAERCATELACHLAKRGCQVRVIALGPPPPPSRQGLALQLASHSIPLHFLGGRSSWQIAKVLFRWRHLVASDRPDVAQGFLFHANILGSLIYPRFRVPWVGGVRVADPRRGRQRMEAWASRRMQRVVCVSQAVAQACRSYPSFAKERIEVIPNGIALRSEIDKTRQIDLRTAHRIPPEAPLLLFVGRWEPQKGFDILLHRLPEILRQLPKHHAVLLGDGSGRSDWKSLQERLDRAIVSRIHAIGFVDRPRDWMAISQLLILPARYEGMPNAVMEAMAEGMAVAVTRVEGIGELLSQEGQEQTVASSDWEGWQQMVVRLASDPERCRSLGAQNRQQIESHFQLPQQLDRYLALYRQLVTPHSR
ncbi:MAG: glycosyltransferase family 4 protein [Pirellulaceae bacterium]